MDLYFSDKVIANAYDRICFRRAAQNLELPCTLSDNMRSYICIMLESVRHIHVTEDCRLEHVISGACTYTEEMVHLANMIANMPSLWPLTLGIDPQKLARLFLLLRKTRLDEVEINERFEKCCTDPEFDKLWSYCNTLK